ncbi:MAG: NADH:flavin oxidoreductase [Oceanospirillaceae bacterium]|nr:NADH:flavin oxidoreductase [Oceanospirillaceae bacterium]
MTTINAILFKPSKIANTVINNRLAVAPMTRVSAEPDGKVGPLMKGYYENYAIGGFGLIITEGLYTDQLHSQAYLNQPGIATPAQADSWKPIIAAVHHQGAVLIAQLMHAGALSQYNHFSKPSIAPSAVQPKGEQMPAYHGEGAYKLPQAMTEQNIEEAVQGFVDAALRAKKAGFAGVEIHGANGYLLDQFLTEYTNQREDSYGGSLDNRLRIYQQILTAVRESVGESFIVGVRFSQKKVNDSQYVWAGGEEAAKSTFAMIKECGADYIHTTEPLLNNAAFGEGESLASLAKKYSGLPIIANGGVSDPQLATDVLESGQADFVALGTIALSNQDWPNLVKNSSIIKGFNFSMLSPLADLENAQRFNKAALSAA